MFSKLFNWKKKELDADENQPLRPGADWSFLGADMHSHFVPGIDDGAKTIDDSLDMLRAMKEMGYKSIITTPHVMIDFHPNTAQTITDGIKKVQDALVQHDIQLNIKAAAEYYIDEYFMELLRKDEPLLTVHNNEVLVEFSMMYEPPMLFDAIYYMQQAGYKPIIAHPERYVFFHGKTAKFSEMKSRGCLMQMNLLAISGYYGKGVKMAAEDLMKKGMYDYCGSDMHHMKHAGVLRAMMHSKDYDTIRNYPFQNARLCF